MKTQRLLSIVAVVIILIACNKDKYTTEPQVNVKSISPETVVFGDILQIKGTFTDNEGDMDSALIVQKYFNGNTPTRIDTLYYSFDDFSLPEKTRDGDFTIAFSYGVFNSYLLLPGSPVTKDTTAAYGLILKDKAGHRSNYSESGKVRLKKN